MQVGSPNGVTTRIRPTLNFRGLKAGKIAWVTGENVAAHLATGTFQLAP